MNMRHISSYALEQRLSGQRFPPSNRAYYFLNSAVANVSNIHPGRYASERPTERKPHLFISIVKAISDVHNVSIILEGVEIFDLEKGNPKKTKIHQFLPAYSHALEKQKRECIVHWKLITYFCVGEHKACREIH